MKDLLRGAAGGIIFGIPVLYTMEVWFEGQVFSSGQLFVILASILLLNILFSYFAGLREKHSPGRLIYAIDDGVTSLGLSIVLAFLVLVLINRVDFHGNFNGEMAKIIVEACIISVGITFTNFKFKSNETGASGGRDVLKFNTLFMAASQRQAKKDLNDIMAAAAGAFVFSFNVAPTEEIVLIASSLSSLNLIVILIAELFFCYLVLYASGLKKAVIYEHQSFFQRPFSEMLLTTSVALIVAGVLFVTVGYGEVHFDDSYFIPSTIVLGLPAVVGGAAGRLVV